MTAEERGCRGPGEHKGRQQSREKPTSLFNPSPLPLCSLAPLLPCPSAPLPPFTSAPLPLRSSSVATDFRDEDAGNNQPAPQPLLRAKSLPQYQVAKEC